MFVWAGNQYNSMHFYLQSDALRCFLKFPLEMFSILHPQGILGVDRTTQLCSLRLLCFAQLSIFSPLIEHMYHLVFNLYSTHLQMA